MTLISFRVAALLLVGLTTIAQATAATHTTYTTKEYIGNDTYHLTTSPDVLNFKTGDEWQRVDTTITPGRDRDYPYEMTRSVYSVQFSGESRGWVALLTHNGSMLSLKIGNLTYTAEGGEMVAATPRVVRATVQDDTITYNGLYGPGTSLTFYALPSRLKAELLIEDNTSLPWPSEELLGLACYDKCHEYDLTLDLGFILTTTLEAPAASLSTSEDLAIGGGLFTLESPVTYSDSIRSTDTQSLTEAEDGTLLLVQKTDWNPLRYDDYYPFVVDPSVSLGYDTLSYVQEITGCNEVGDCCGLGGGFSACVQTYSCGFASVGGLTKYVKGHCNCDVQTDPEASGECQSPCIDQARCCGADGSAAGSYAYCMHNMSTVTTAVQAGGTVVDANHTVSITTPFGGIDVFDYHVDDNSTPCTFDHACGESQPASQTTAASLVYSITSHVNYTAQQDENIHTQVVYTDDMGNSAKNKVTNCVLDITYTEGAAEEETTRFLLIKATPLFHLLINTLTNKTIILRI